MVTVVPSRQRWPSANEPFGKLDAIRADVLYRRGADAAGYRRARF
jgi:hypothetical protein